MAAPHVAGVAAPLAAANPEATMEEIRSAILDGAVPIPSLTNNVATGALLNASGALAAFQGVSRTAGVVIRGEEIVVNSIWDDTDIVHVLQDEIIVNNLHTATSLKLLSQPDASLVVKLAGPAAGFTASGELLDIDDRVGGTVQVIGQPGFPVVLTSLYDDTVGASLDAYGFPVTDTNVDGTVSQPGPGDWRSLQFLPLSNDRNVAMVRELELPFTTSDIDANGAVGDAEYLGTLAPNYATDGNTWESAQEKSGDESRRLGFDVSGTIAFNEPTDVDVYSFDGYAGSEVWVDIDQTTTSLDSMVEVLDASGRVLARSANSQTDTGSVTGVAVEADAGGLTTVAGEQAAVIGAAAAVTAVGAEVQGEELMVTGVADRPIGYVAKIQAVAAQVVESAFSGQAVFTVNDATGIAIGAVATLGGIVAPNSIVITKNGNTITLDKPLISNITADRWVEFSVAGDVPISSRFVIFDTPPEDGVWVGTQGSGNVVLATHPDVSTRTVTELSQPINIEPVIARVQSTNTFVDLGRYDEAGDAVDNQNTGLIAAGGENFYRLNSNSPPAGGDERSIWANNAITQRPTQVLLSLDVRMQDWVRSPGPVFVFQDNDQVGGSTLELPSDLRDLSNTDTTINQLVIHLDPISAGNSIDGPSPHISFTYDNWSNYILLPANLLNPLNDVWSSIAFNMVPVSGGTDVSVTLGGANVGTMLVPGYSLRSDTLFQIGNQAGSNSGGFFDIDDIGIEQFFNGGGIVEEDLSFGLDSTNDTTANRLIFSEVDPDLLNREANGGSASVTDVDVPEKVVTLSSPIAVNANSFVEFDVTAASWH